MSVAAAPASVQPPPAALVALGALGVLATAAAATALPLLVYSVSLAAFGLAHVLAELRYVDTRFGARIAGRLRGSLVALLVGVFALRALAVVGVQLPHAKLLELGLVVALCATVLPALLARSRALGALSGLVVVGFAALAWRWPLETLFVLTFTHNLTPVGFVAERLRGRQRALALVACAAVFGLIPLSIASGLPLRLLEAWGAARPEASVLPTVTDLGAHLGAFLPQSLQRDPERTLSLFAAAAYLQCMHYAAVLHVLPGFDAEGGWSGPQNLLPWPTRGRFTVALVGAGALLAVFFWVDFAGARRGYGTLAAVHAWVELPLLLLALGVPAEPAAPPVSA
ncbi:MAG: hypothetical protein KDD82_03845 [Planctomycetes bacterium]|nr:hypothetical protein [Planctomycetota bacterium]